MRTFALPIIFAAALVAAAPMSIAKPAALEIAVYGDAPYGTAPTDTAEFDATPAFIDSINADPDVSLVLHVGDIHSGSQFCTEAYDRAVFDLWSAFRAPVVYVPGDNEWTDCHKKKEGGGVYNAATGTIDYVLDANGDPVDYAKGDPIANLALIRSIFFARPGFAIGDSKLVLPQSLAFDRRHPSDHKYVENVMWVQAGVLFVTVNIPGGSNNDSDPWYGVPTETPAQTQERNERTGADLRWLDAAFALAHGVGARAIVIQSQADMWDLDGKVPSHIVQYKPFIDAIAAKTAAFGKPVLLFEGDSHVYRSDNPLVNDADCAIESGASSVACGPANDAYDNQPNGYNVSNFHRVVVHGSTFPLEWLKLTINARSNGTASATSFGPFSWERMIQPLPQP